MKIIRNYTLILLTIIVLSASGAVAQTERDKGLELYKQGKYSEAISVLEQAAKQKAFKKDGDVWNFLGLAFLNRGETKNGRKALEKSVKYAPQNSIFRSNLAYAYFLEGKRGKAKNEIQKAIQLNPKNTNAYYIRGKMSFWGNNNRPAIEDAERALTIDPTFTAAYILQAEGLMLLFGEVRSDMSKPGANLDLIERAAASLKQCLEKCPKDSSLESVEQNLEIANEFLDRFSQTKDLSDTSETQSDTPETQNDNFNKTPFRLLSKPKPAYTNAARSNNVKGTVRLRVFFGLDGKIKSIWTVKGLEYGLTEQAINAAKSIRFDPPTKDGKPFSTIKVIDFNFTIY